MRYEISELKGGDGPVVERGSFAMRRKGLKPRYDDNYVSTMTSQSKAVRGRSAGVHGDPLALIPDISPPKTSPVIPY